MESSLSEKTICKTSACICIRGSDAGTECPWLIVVQMNNLNGHCDAAFEKKKNMFLLLLLTCPLPCVGSGIYPVTKKLYQEVIWVKTKLFFPPMLVSRKHKSWRKQWGTYGWEYYFFKEQNFIVKAWSVVFSGTCMLNNSTHAKI